MKPQQRRTPLVALVFGVVLLAGAAVSVAVYAAEDLRIWIGEKRQTVDSRENRGKSYYELKDVAGALGLDLEEQDGRGILSGPKGRLELNDGRPLVRSKDGYILLGQPVWRRRAKDWYVSEDFFDKALPLILSQELERVGPSEYRLKAFGENRVVIEVTNFPDHVRIVFTPTKKLPVRVMEFENLIRVEFDEYLVIPALPATKPDAAIVAGIQFNPADVYGAFDIRKGKGFYNFREYSLEEPARRVIDVYAPPVTARRQTVQPAPTPALPPPEPARQVQSPSESADAELLPAFEPRDFRNVVTVDPGHGGEDYGVRLAQEDFEKHHTLRLAKQIEQRLASTHYRGVLTRREDIKVGAAQRSAIANYHESRCYVSVHVGGAPSRETAGPVVYVHSHGGGFGRRTQDEGEGLLDWDTAQVAYLAESRSLANALQGELNKLYGTENKVVEAPLAHLASVSAPAVLVEMGYLTNPEDRQRLARSDFQDRIAGAVVTAVQRFLQ